MFTFSLRSIIKLKLQWQLYNSRSNKTEQIVLDNLLSKWINLYIFASISISNFTKLILGNNCKFMERSWTIEIKKHSFFSHQVQTKMIPSPTCSEFSEKLLWLSLLPLVYQTHMLLQHQEDTANRGLLNWP